MSFKGFLSAIMAHPEHLLIKSLVLSVTNWKKLEFIKVDLKKKWTKNLLLSMMLKLLCLDLQRLDLLLILPWIVGFGLCYTWLFKTSLMMPVHITWLFWSVLDLWSLPKSWLIWQKNPNDRFSTHFTKMGGKPWVHIWSFRLWYALDRSTC